MERKAPRDGGSFLDGRHSSAGIVEGKSGRSNLEKRPGRGEHAPDGWDQREGSAGAGWTEVSSTGGGASGSLTFRGRLRNGCRPNSVSFSAEMP